MFKTFAYLSAPVCLILFLIFKLNDTAFINFLDTWLNDSGKPPVKITFISKNSPEYQITGKEIEKFARAISKSSSDIVHKGKSVRYDINIYFDNDINGRAKLLYYPESSTAIFRYPQSTNDLKEWTAILFSTQEYADIFR